MTSPNAARSARGSSRPHRSDRSRGTGAPRRPAASLLADVETPTTPTPVDHRSFAELGVRDRLVATLAAADIVAPFPIQSATLPDSLTGRDVLGRGQTGSGKTLAFALPVVSRLADSGNRRTARAPRALVLAPTRELARQVEATIAPLAAALGQTTALVFGGVSQGSQVVALRAGVDILVACPGRLEDLIAQGHISLDKVEVAVLDEADHMADLGFLPAVRRLLDQTPAGGQRLLFSATLDNGVDVLVRRYLVDPVVHAVAHQGSVVTMTHHVFTVAGDDKAEVVRELASGQGRSLLFTRTRSGAKRLAAQLTKAGVPAVDLHGDLAQRARERNLAAFSSGSVRVLVATDLAARGIHVDDIELVVHVDPPAEHKAYVHRSGRTARAGSAGTVVTVATRDQVREVATLTRRAAIDPTTTAVAPGSAEILALTGPPAAFVEPAPPAPVAAPTRSSRPRGARSASASGRPRSSTGGAAAASSRGMSRRRGR